MAISWRGFMLLQFPATTAHFWPHILLAQAVPAQLFMELSCKLGQWTETELKQFYVPVSCCPLELLQLVQAQTCLHSLQQAVPSSVFPSPLCQQCKWSHVGSWARELIHLETNPAKQTARAWQRLSLTLLFWRAKLVFSWLKFLCPEDLDVMGWDWGSRTLHGSKVLAPKSCVVKLPPVLPIAAPKELCKGVWTPLIKVPVVFEHLRVVISKGSNKTQVFPTVNQFEEGSPEI